MPRPHAETARPRRDDDEYDPNEPLLLIGRNPIREALKNGQSMDKLLVADGDLTGTATQIVAAARSAGVVVQFVDRRRLDAMAAGHQGLIAQLPAAQYASVEDILKAAEEKNEPPFIVVLDGVTDPHNLGAIIRTAEAMGAHGVITGKRRASGLTPAALKASAGAGLYLPVAREGNIAQVVERLKKLNIWTYAAVMDGPPAHTVDFAGPLALVIGDEGMGVSQVVQKVCDQAVGIPMTGRVGSLNASVAAGILLYEVASGRRGT